MAAIAMHHGEGPGEVGESIAMKQDFMTPTTPELSDSSPSFDPADEDRGEVELQEGVDLLESDEEDEGEWAAEPERPLAEEDELEPQIDQLADDVEAALQIDSADDASDSSGPEEEYDDQLSSPDVPTSPIAVLDIPQEESTAFETASTSEDGAPADDVMASDIMSDDGEKRSAANSIHMDEESVVEQPTTPTFVALTQMNSRQLAYGEQLPPLKTEKLRLKIFNMRKVQGAKQAKRVNRKGSMKDLGELMLEAVDKVRPQFADLVPLEEVAAHSGYIWTMAYSADGKMLATGGEDGMVNVWRLCDMVSEVPVEEVAQEPAAEADEAESATVLPLKTVKAAKEVPKMQYNGRLMDPKPIAQLDKHTADVVTVAWTANGQLLSASIDGTVRLWELNGCTTVRRIACPSSVSCMAAHPNKSKYVVTGSMDKAVRVWDIETGDLLYTQSTPDIPTALAFSRDGITLLLGLKSGQVQVRDSKTMKLASTVKVSSSKITGLSVSKKGRQFIVGVGDSKVRAFEGTDFKKGEQIKLTAAKQISKTQKVKGHRTAGLLVAPSLSEDERFIISGSEDGSVYIWDRQDESGGSVGYERWSVDVGGGAPPVTSATFVPQICVDRCIRQMNADSEMDLRSPAVKPLSDDEGSSGMRRALSHFSAHQDMNEHRTISALNAMNRGDSQMVDQMTRERRRISGSMKAGEFQVEQSQRTSTALLHAMRRQSRGSLGVVSDKRDDVPTNGVILASDASGTIRVYAKASIAKSWQEFTARHA